MTSTVTKLAKNVFAVEGKIMFFRAADEPVCTAFKTNAKAQAYAARLDENNAAVLASRAEDRLVRLELARAYLAVRAARAAVDARQVAFNF